MDDIELGVLIPVGQAQWGGERTRASCWTSQCGPRNSGYSSLWVNDFLLTPRIEALTMLAAVAPLTSRVTLGTAALLPVLRRPVQAAQTLASIDLLSGGRLVLTVGAAFPGRFGEPQHALSDVPWERRFTRLDETVALWRQLWALPGGGSFHGELLRFERAAAHDRAVPPRRAAGLAGRGVGVALRRTGRHYDGWLPYPPVAGRVRRRAGRGTRRRCRGWPRRGRRDTRAIRVRSGDGHRRAGAASCSATFAEASYGMPLDQLEQIQALAAGPPDVVAEKLRGYVAAGARHLVVRIATTSLESQREQLEEIIKLKEYL